MSARAWWRVAPIVFALAWGGNHFSPLLLLYRQQEGYPQVVVDVLFAAYIVGIIPGFLICGPLSDRFGRKPVLLAGVVLGLIGSAILGLGAASIPLLTIGRLVSRRQRRRPRWSSAAAGSRSCRSRSPDRPPRDGPH